MMSCFIGLPQHQDLQTSSGDEEEDDIPEKRGKAFVIRKSSSESSKADGEDVLILNADMSDELFRDEVEDEGYGPILPSKLKESSAKVKRKSKNEDLSQGSKLLGPELPPKHKTRVSSSEKYIGPELPPHLIRQHCSEDEVISKPELSSNSQDDGYGERAFLGPALPPSFKSQKRIDASLDSIGPSLPPAITLQTSSETDSYIPTEDVSSDSDSEVVGPQLIPDIGSQSQQLLEMRARRLRRNMSSKHDPAEKEHKRESWMLELPPEKAVDLGLGSRQFRKRETADPGDRSVWTDTPADRMKKKLDPKPAEPDRAQLKMKAVQDRDEAMNRLAEKHSSKRGGQSLLEMHQEKLKKKKKKDEKEGKTQERRPFSRELDLQTNRFDEAQKKSIFNKARLLNDRFSAGHSKYL